MAEITKEIGEIVEDNILNEMEDVAEQVYRADPNEAVKPLSFDDPDTDLSNTVKMTIEVRGQKRNVEVLLIDEFQKIELREIRIPSSEAVREYDEMFIDLMGLPEAEVVAAEREYRKKMSPQDSLELEKRNADYNKYILLNFIVKPKIIEFKDQVAPGTPTPLEKVPQDVRTKMIIAFQTANSPKEVLAKVGRFQGVGESTREPVSASEQVSPSGQTEA